MNKEYVSGRIKDISGEDTVRIDEPLKNHTSFKLGGNADILVTPKDIESLGSVYKFCRAEEIPVFIMGNGTNLIVRDKGIRGVIIKVFENLSKFEVYDDIIEAEAGILLSRVSKIALANSLSGIEFAEGIPGTLGGAVAMNAGAYSGEMKDVIYKTEYLDFEGNIKSVVGEQHGFGYRTSFIQKEGGIVLKTQLKLRKADSKDIKAAMDDYNRRRVDKQPLEMPSAGSVFKRSEGHFTGKLVEDCGLRGCRIGGAEVSCKHCGFIVNAGNATAEDVTNLIKHIQATVKERFGVDLQTEVKIVGEE